jgi:hypothetical protein
VLSGENCEARLKVRKGRGRGYLFGKVHTSEPWLRIEPASFRERLDAIVSADTESLPISHTPWQAQILVESTSTDEPIPVRVRVVAMPSTLNRYVLRPLAGALAAGLIGAGVGAALGAAGLAVPAWVARRLATSPAPVLFWAAAFWVVWAVLGALRGQKQPRHWPVSYAAARWLLRLAAWGIALSALAALGQKTWTHFGPLEAAASGPSVEIVALLGLALSILPATLAEVRLGRTSGVVTSPPRRRPGRRTFLLLFGLALALCVVLGVPLLGRAWQVTDVNRAIVSAREWATSRWSQAETKAGEWMDRLFLRYYDRRAPASTPTPLHTATPPSATTPLLSTTPTPALTPAPPTLAPAPTLEGLTP